MREKLLEIIGKHIGGYNCGMEIAAEIADELLAEGVIVPPCNIGQTVYVTDIIDGKIFECEIISIECFVGCDDVIIEYKAPEEIPHIVSYESPSTEIGETVFLTREEAEKALERRDG